MCSVQSVNIQAYKKIKLYQEENKQENKPIANSDYGVSRGKI